MRTTITLPASEVQALIDGKLTEARRVVGVKAPKWARSAIRALDAPGEWWWTDRGDPVKCHRTEAPFQCPYGARNAVISVSSRAHAPLNSMARIADVRVERKSRADRWMWVLTLDPIKP